MQLQHDMAHHTTSFYFSSTEVERRAVMHRVVVLLQLCALILMIHCVLM